MYVCLFALYHYDVYSITCMSSHICEFEKKTSCTKNIHLVSTTIKITRIILHASLFGLSRDWVLSFFSSDLNITYRWLYIFNENKRKNILNNILSKIGEILRLPFFIQEKYIFYSVINNLFRISYALWFQ